MPEYIYRPALSMSPDNCSLSHIGAFRPFIRLSANSRCVGWIYQQRVRLCNGQYKRLVFFLALLIKINRLE